MADEWAVDEVNEAVDVARAFELKSDLPEVKRFRKASCPIVLRLGCYLMMPGRGNGKKLITVRIVKHSFEIIHLLTEEAMLLLCTGAREVAFRNIKSAWPTS
ncbi:hypothetical protein PRIPAC_73547 [Pristionchus pacificus]|uniref:Uncharacterized protein n=1 Tax=Pristionchus pacificus TaxID=54126 RepID=A0A2A6C912_PRIPA|nr:hypothetical protein PRIPAC_73547 [Pristionchus pacificus]|eukprot:PDM74511.1 hypothetical protein PRIPAC_41867 [Pristionchus pacificus]